MSIPVQTRKNVIVQMFNRPFRDIQPMLQNLSDIGYSYIQISPPQKSHPSEEWWGRYQPVDFTVIDGPLGTEEELRDLCREASVHGIQIIADVVLNHMANHPDYVEIDNCTLRRAQYPQFSINDFHPVINHETDSIQGWLNCDLPDLRTESRHVRDEARNFLHMLVDIGIGGFRFDAAKHIEAEFFDFILTRLEGLFLYGEFVESNPERISHNYIKSMDAYDFPLARTMKVAFGWGGDLRTLVNPAGQGRALPGASAVTFVKHHDIDMHPDWFEFFHIADPVDESLAYAYLMARRDGTPFVYIDRFDSDIVKAGVKFHNLAMGHIENWIVTDMNCLALRRGQHMLAAINKQSNIMDLSGIQTGLREGSYRELITDTVVNLSNNNALPYQVQGRSAAFFVREVD